MPRRSQRQRRRFQSHSEVSLRPPDRMLEFPTGNGSSDDMGARLPHSNLASRRAYAAMCTFGICELCQHSTEILLRWWHRERHPFCAHLLIESLNIGNAESQLDGASRILYRV